MENSSQLWKVFKKGQAQTGLMEFKNKTKNKELFQLQSAELTKETKGWNLLVSQLKVEFV